MSSIICKDANLASILGTQHDIAPPLLAARHIFCVPSSGLACRRALRTSSAHKLNSGVRPPTMTESRPKRTTLSTPGPGSPEPGSFPLVGSHARHDASSPAPPTLQIDVARRWVTGTVYDGGGGGGRRPGRGERVCRRRLCGVSGARPPPTRRGYSPWRIGRIDGGGHVTVGPAPPPPPTRMLRRSKHEMTAVAGRRANASHRTNERSFSPPTSARFLSWRICWGWVLIKSHGPIIHFCFCTFDSIPVG